MYLWFLEFKKMFLRTGMLLLVLALLVVNAGKININGNLDPKALESQVHWGDSDIARAEQQFSGRITEENMRLLLNGYQQWITMMRGEGQSSAEAMIYYQLYPHYAYLYDYHFSNAETLRQAEENISFFIAVGNEYDAAVNHLYTALYAERYISDYYNSEDFAILFEYDFSTLLLFLSALIGSAAIFWKERQDGTYDLLQTSIYGKKRMVSIKLSAYFVWLFCVAAMLYTEDVIAHSILYHLEGWTNPVYAVESYRFSTFSGSIWEYVICSAALRLLAVMEAGACFALITLLFKGNILPISLNLLVFFGWLILSEQVTEISLYGFLNPVAVMKPRTYTEQFTVVNLLGEPVSGAVGACIVTALMLVLLLILITVCWHCKMGWQRPHRRKGSRYAEK